MHNKIFSVNLVWNIMLILVLTIALSLRAHAHEAHVLQWHGDLATATAFDQQGKLWRVTVKKGFIQVDSSTDLGKSFSEPVKLNQSMQKIGANNEARPDIALDAKNNIYVSWTQNLKTRFAGYIWFARSIDGGKTFEKPYIVHQDREEITHAFNALNVAQDGKIIVTWIDKRDALNAKRVGKNYDGAAIYYAVSNNRGESFEPEQKLVDSSCECCRIVTTNKPDGTTAVLWRHVFEGNERDHMIAEIPQNNATPQPHRATFGHWEIDGCPHHGAALAVGGDAKDWWGYHMAYFDGNDAKATDKADDKTGPGLYYSRLDGSAWVSSPAKKFGNNANQAGHPAILSMRNPKGAERVWLVWREMEAKAYKIKGMLSDDGGRSWSGTKVLASTTGKADYPQLIHSGQQVYLSWNTASRYRLIPLK